MAASSSSTGAHPWARLAAMFVLGIGVGALVFAVAVAGLGYTYTSSSIGQVTIGSVWVNSTYTTATPANDSQPLNEFFQNFVPGQGSGEGAVGSHLGFTMSPYDNSTVACTLWSLSVFSPFKLVSVTVTALPGANETVHEPLPVVLTPSVHGTSHWANLWIVIVLPSGSGTYPLVMAVTASCDPST